MKRRVRGLLQKDWLAPLGALVLAVLPMALVGALIFLFVAPRSSMGVQALQLPLSFTDLRSFLFSLLSAFSSPSLFFAPLVGWLPTIIIFLGVTLLVSMPISVSLAGYFMTFLRGKNPRILSVYDCFSGRYPRALGGMAYMLLWHLLWFAVSFVVPTVLLFAGAPFVSALGIELFHQLYAFGAIVILCVLWYIVFTFVFINRTLAYALTPIALAAQPRLPAYRAVRLSRKLMRGSKMRLLGLFLSFLTYFIPAIVSLILLALLPRFGPGLGLGDSFMRILRIVLYGILIANQLVWVYVAPYMSACFHAYYLERKREALMDEEVTPDDFGSKPKPEDTAVPASRA